jgi:hypothetical protein
MRMELPARPWSIVALLLLVATLLRCADFGNPVIHVDEQYYLLVGDRLLHGAVPYLDIWDRKPIGLFLLFAAIRLLPGDGILAYQLVATLFVAATAWTVDRSATRLGASRRGALAAAIGYILWVSLLNGRGGQSPVFYNLPVAIAALLTLRLPDLAAARDTRAIWRNAVVVCLLAGIAIQFKYTPAFEGAFFGLAHLWFLHRAGTRWPAVISAAFLWALAGLAPTLAAIGWYAALGRAALDAFWFANVTSITLRPPYPLDQIAMRLLGIVAQLSPLIVASAVAWRWRPRTGAAASRARLAFGWLLAATLGFLSIGTFFDHYGLPLVAPLLVVASPALSHSNRLLIASLGLAAMLFVIKLAQRPDDASGARAVAAVVAANSGSECPWVAIGDTITYRLADACLPTAYAFPNLLVYNTEQGATGIDEAAEVHRILDARPPVIVTSSRRLSIWNATSVRQVKAALARDYREIFRTPRAGYHTVVYLRRDRVPVRP